MNARFELSLDQAAFTCWLDGQRGRYEWKEGRVVQTANVTRAHRNIVTNFVLALGARLDRRVWSISAVDFRVEKASFTRFPDVLVEPAGGNPKGRRAEAPIVLIEVLSPSSIGIDMTEKPTEYTSFDALEIYIVASQDEPICWVWQRPPRSDTVESARPFPETPAEIAGRDQTVVIPSLGIELPLREIFFGISDD